MKKITQEQINWRRYWLNIVIITDAGILAYIFIETILKKSMTTTEYALIFILTMIFVYSIGKMKQIIMPPKTKIPSEFISFDKSYDTLETFYQSHQNMNIEFKTGEIWNSLLITYHGVMFYITYLFIWLSLRFLSNQSMQNFKTTILFIITLISIVLWGRMIKDNGKIKIFIATKYPSIITYDLESIAETEYSIIFNTMTEQYHFLRYEDDIKEELEKRIMDKIKDCEKTPHARRIFIIHSIQYFRDFFVRARKRISKIMNRNNIELK